MALPFVDFNAIAAIAHEAIQAYGSPALFFELNNPVGRAVRVVIYKDTTAAPLIQEMDVVAASGLLDVQDFQGVNRAPQQFDKVEITADGITEAWTLKADPHPVYAGHRLPIFIVELERG